MSTDELRAEMLARWERAATGWGKHAQRMREFGMPVSAWMLDHARLQPGQRVLELAAGPGDTGLLAAELIRPGGTLLSTDAAETMLNVARTRAAAFGIENVEFKRMDIEW
ncbi:MAG: methyltransferase domain-containing protein, partial [Solirubrobacterales bacterium]|nr:methyltransferase domain-containing protein [Solirubrobacterales bacterium]